MPGVTSIINETNFENRWREGLEHFCRVYAGNQAAGANPTPGVAAVQQAKNKVLLENAFKQTPFIYGTVGADPMHYGGSGSSALVRGIYEMNRLVRVEPKTPRRTRTDFAGQPDQAYEDYKKQEDAKVVQRFFRDIARRKSTYDPGPRTREYIRNGYQMMDMYYGMHGKNRNRFWRHRNVIIAEFVHYVMGFHNGRNPVAFDANEPGWRAFERAYPNANEGWVDNPRTTTRYGQSGTKEMSKIIREGIKRFGGKLIFEGRDVFGHNIFSTNGVPRDTDIEALALFEYFGQNPNSATVPFGAGQFEFQWGGQPTVPTRAHFLTNWSFSATRQTHTPHNRERANGGMANWIGFLRGAMQAAPAGFTPLWRRFANVPADMRAGRVTTHRMIEAIDRLSALP